MGDVKDIFDDYVFKKNNRWDTSGSVSVSFITQTLSDSNVGDDIYNRIGRICAIQSIDVKINVYPVMGANSMPQMAKIAIVWDMAAEGLVPPPPNIFWGDATLAGSMGASSPYSFRNCEMEDRSRVLLEKSLYLQGFASTDTQPLGPYDTIGQSLCIEEYMDVSWLKLTTSYQEGSNMSSTGQLYLVLWSQSPCSWMADYQVRVVYDQRDFGSHQGALEGPMRAKGL